MAQNIVAFIFARGGSKGLPRKNVRPLAGVPLIGRAVKAALAAKGVTRCVVSTDDAEIAEVARQYGAETPFMRPPELATDTAPEWKAWQHAIATLEKLGTKIDVFLSVPATAPLRNVEDIDHCLALFAKGGADVVVTASHAQRSPYFNMVTLNADGGAQLVIKPDTAITARQAAPKVYDMTTVAYVADPAFIMRANGLFEGRVKAVIVPPERAVDIDTELDFRFAELLMAERQKEG